MTEQRPHPSDLSDARWKFVKPALNAWRAERRSKYRVLGRAGPPAGGAGQVVMA
jgi:hypothetical protein